MIGGRKLSLAVFKFTSCDGCQLQILNLEDELVELAGSVDIAYFLEATSANRPGPYDLAIIEGSISTPHELERIQEIRKQSRTLIALGTCATAGGIQALRNFASADSYAQLVYPRPEYLHYLKTVAPIGDHVHVDFELWGCPIDKGLLLEVITALLHNRTPALPPYSVCLECKRRSTVCVMVSSGIPCLGPGTRAGCGAICPAFGRGCYGCFGPTASTNLDWLAVTLHRHERHPGETERLFRNFSGYAPAFRSSADAVKTADDVVRRISNEHK